MPDRLRIILGLTTSPRNVKHSARIIELDNFEQAPDIFQERGYTELGTAYLWGRYSGGFQETGGLEGKGPIDRDEALSPEPRHVQAGGPYSRLRDGPEGIRSNTLPHSQAAAWDLHRFYRTAPSPPPKRFQTSTPSTKQASLSVLASRTTLLRRNRDCHHNGWVRSAVYQAIYD
ncbi:hypothetical protein BJ170DRAFT_595066 [Xylariales sp. AK1849]|nr:hypothetical protein BJ170DRAFT_595066 [Xylariales sp. AK1849]